MSQLPRYESYKDSGVQWLGEIPNHWNTMAVRRILEEHRQGYYTNEPYIDDGVKLARITDIQQTSEMDLDNSPRVENKAELKEFFLKENDFLFARTGGAGSFGIVRQKDLPAVYASYLIRFRFKENIEAEYLKFFFKSSYFLNSLVANIHGGVNQNIHAEDIKSTFLALPPVEEQKKIANFLNNKVEKVNALIAKQETLLEKLAEQRVALISHAVAKGLNSDVKLQKSKSEILGLYPETWKVKRLRFEIETNPSKAEIELNDSELVSFIPMEAVSVGGGLDLSNERMISEVSSGYTYFADGDVVVAKITPCFENGKASIAENLHQNIAFGTTELHVLRCKENLLNKFLFFIIQSDKFMKYGESEMYGAGGQKRVPERFIKNYLIALPSLDEQQQICDFIESQLSHLDGLVQKVESTISIFNEYRSTLITQVVTGKIDVRNLKVN
ncbi:restriction endonuclease subunit S [Acinetobacter johnsonii]|uniref:restriction endonuclease subunit S n=1 Tax=Acinetobacter johnsonii TaxID=40214 RepID=UPI00132F9BC9|nr:restriction endonuclease subunit S [Acinetobacter johnsonii]